MKSKVTNIISAALLVSFIACGNTDLVDEYEDDYSDDYSDERSIEDQIDLNKYSVSTEDRENTYKELKTLKEKLNNLENSILAPAQEDLDEYKDILANGKIKIIRILGSNSVVTQTDGGGNYYSFGLLTHEYGYGSDLSLRGSQFEAGFAGADYGFFTDLGDMKLSNVNTSTSGVKYASKYKVPVSEGAARREKSRFDDGIFKKGYEYNSNINIQNGNVYALRSIIFGEYDILVAFKVVRIDKSDNSVILLWKILKKYNTPDI